MHAEEESQRSCGHCTCNFVGADLRNNCLADRQEQTSSHAARPSTEQKQGEEGEKGELKAAGDSLQHLKM